jgi:hypothetical protein
VLIVKILPVTLFRDLVAAFMAAYDSENCMVSEAACVLKIIPKALDMKGYV